MRSQGFGAFRVQGREGGGREGAEVTGKSQKAFTQNLLINITRRAGDGKGTCTGHKEKQNWEDTTIRAIRVASGVGAKPKPKETQ